MPESFICFQPCWLYFFFFTKSVITLLCDSLPLFGLQSADCAESWKVIVFLLPDSFLSLPFLFLSFPLPPYLCAQWREQWADKAVRKCTLFFNWCFPLMSSWGTYATSLLNKSLTIVHSWQTNAWLSSILVVVSKSQSLFFRYFLHFSHISLNICIPVCFSVGYFIETESWKHPSK